MYESQADLGFVSYNDRDNDRGSSVTELWAKNCFQQALVQGINYPQQQFTFKWYSN